VARKNKWRKVRDMPEVGIHQGISNEEYHKGPGLSSSGMKKIAISPLHFKTPQFTDSEALIRGTATHCAVFEPERFAEEYIVEPDGVNRRTKAGRAEVAELAETGKIVLKRGMFEDVQGMATAVLTHKIASEYVTGGVAEQSVYWLQHVKYGEKEETKILCKARPDYVIELENGDYVIVDLKTARDARPGAFERHSYWDYGYHISAAHYITGMTSILGKHPISFVFIAVEPEPPYGVITYFAEKSFLNYGFLENEAIYKTYAECFRTDNWPCYPEVMFGLKLPRGA
jgi:exodeoxyribonuclease VIII